MNASGPRIATATPGRSARRRRGVTLIELIIVVLVTGILAAVAAPRFASLSTRYRAESVAKRIAADLNYARRTASLNSRNCTVQFQTSPLSYQMTGVTNPNRPSLSYSVALADLDLDATLPTIDFNSATSVTFVPQGSPLAGSPLAALTTGSVVVQVGSQQFTVSIDPATGKATVP